MKFNLWLEAKESRKIMYHGTSSILLPRIMSEGLQPFPKNRTWHADPDSSFDNPSRASYGGIYITTNLMTALSSAGKISRSTQSNKLLICVDVHPYSLIADEDNVTYHVKNIKIPNLLTTEYSLGNVYVPWLLLKNKKFITSYFKKNPSWGKQELKRIKGYVASVKTHYIDASLKQLFYGLKNAHPKMIENVKDILEKYGFEAAMTRQAAYIDPYSLRKIYDDYGYDGLPTPPEKTKAEEKYKEFVDKLSRALKKTASGESSLMNHGRLLKPVGFSGKDKIVSIIEIFRKPDSYKEFIKISYGTPPQQLIEDWKKHEGDWIIEKD